MKELNDREIKILGAALSMKQAMRLEGFAKKEIEIVFTVGAMVSELTRLGISNEEITPRLDNLLKTKLAMIPEDDAIPAPASTVQ